MIFKLMQNYLTTQKPNSALRREEAMYKLFYYLQHFENSSKPESEYNLSGMRLSHSEVITPAFAEEFLSFFSKYGCQVAKLKGFYAPSLLASAIKSAKQQIVGRDLRDFHKNLPKNIKLFNDKLQMNFTTVTDFGVVLP